MTKLKAYFSRHYLILMIIAIILCIASTLIFHHQKYSYFEASNNGLLLFYQYISPTDNVLFAIIISLIATHLCGINHLIDKKNHLSYMIKTRLTSKETIKTELVLNYLVAFITYLMIMIAMLLTIHFFIDTVSFANYAPDASYIFEGNCLSSNYIINLILVLILSSSGYALFATIIYALSYFFKNLYIYRAFGFIILMLLIIIPTSINMAMPFMSFFTSIFYLPNLLAATTSGFGAYTLPLPNIIMYLLSYISYALTGYLLLKYGYKNEYELDK